MFVDSEAPKGRCEGCRYARTIYATGNWKFIGCVHEPYKGKWVAQIEYCPKKDGESDGQTD